MKWHLTPWVGHVTGAQQQMMIFGVQTGVLY